MADNTDNDPFEQARQAAGVATNQNALPGTGGGTSLLDYALAPLRGAKRSFLDYMYNASPVSTGALTAPDINEQMQQLPKYEPFKEASEAVPKPKNQIEAAAQGAGEAIGSPSSYIMGPSGVVPSVISNAVTAWRNAAAPEYPILNNIYGTLAGTFAPVGTLGKLGKIAAEGMGISEKPALIAAQDALDIGRGTAAGATDSPIIRKATRALRESPFSGAIENTENEGKQQLEQAVENQASTLGPPSTHEKVGINFQDAAKAWGDDAEKPLHLRSMILDRQVDPSTVMVDMGPVIARLRQQFHVPEGAVNGDPAANEFVNAIEKEAQNYGLKQRFGANWQAYQNAGYRANSLEIPLSAVKYMKQNIADDLKLGILDNSELSVKHNTAAFGAMADAERGAYASTPYLSDFNQLQNDWHNYFENLKTSIKPYIEPDSKTGADALTSLLSKVGIGGEKVDRTLSILPQEIKNEVASHYLRTLGQDRSGAFNPDTFFKNWQDRGLSPEAKVALFGDQNSDIPAIYDQLATVAKSQAQSIAARNPSQTAGTNEMLRMFRNFTHFAALPLAATGVGAASAYYGQPGIAGDSDTERLIKGAGAGIGTYALGMMVGPKLFTNPAFVRLLATDPPMQQLPVMLRAIAANNPKVAPEITAFQNYIQQKNDQEKNDPDDPFEQARRKAKGLRSGGFVDFPDQTPTVYNGGGPAGHWLNMQQGYAEGGTIEPMPEGMIEPGNIDLNKRPVVHNPDGSISTERSISFGTDKGEVIVPTIVNGKEVSPKEAQDHYYKTGEHLGIFDTPDNADKYAQATHTRQGEHYNSKASPDFLNFKSTPNGKSGGQDDENIEPKGYALGGLTDEPHGVKNRNYPMGYWGGGMTQAPFYSGQPAMAYAEGGDVPASSVTAMNNLRSISGEGGSPYPFVKPMPMQPSLLEMFMQSQNFRNELAQKGFKGFSQGGISTDINDPRPFYNPQLPRVQSGGWAYGGMVGTTSELEYAQGGLGPGEPENPTFSARDQTFPEGAIPAFQNVAALSAVGPHIKGFDLPNAEAVYRGNAKLTQDQIDALLPRISKAESNDRNVPNYRYDATHTAGGYYQITNTNWRHYAPLLGIEAKDAMSATRDEQKKVATLMLKENGLAPWDKAHGGPFNVNGDVLNAKNEMGTKMGPSPNEGQPDLLTLATNEAKGNVSSDQDEVELDPELAKIDFAIQNNPIAEPVTKFAASRILRG